MINWCLIFISLLIGVAAGFFTAAIAVFIMRPAVGTLQINKREEVDVYTIVIDETFGDLSKLDKYHGVMLKIDRRS